MKVLFKESHLLQKEGSLFVCIQHEYRDKNIYYILRNIYIYVHEYILKVTISLCRSKDGSDKAVT